MSNKIAAVYCVYEDSGFLHESVRRIYGLMDKIVFLVNFKPWNGNGDSKYIQDTYSTILNIFDPDKKIEIISAYWETEADQRNFGLDHLHKNEINWCFIIDDDEMYNYEDLKKAIHEKIYKSTEVVFLSPHQIYWKTRNFCIDQIALALPSFCKTDRNLLYFNEARAIRVNQGYSWYTFKPVDLVCHHFSYVRSDEQMERKIQNFSHADPSLKNWYKDVWLKWQINSEDLHPNSDNRGSFKKAVSALESPFKLEHIIVDKKFEKFLQSIKINAPNHLQWLRNNSNYSFINFIHSFVLNELKQNLKYTVYGDVSTLEFYSICEAVLKSGLEENCLAMHKDTTTQTHGTYRFCVRNEISSRVPCDIVLLNDVQDYKKIKTRYMITDKDIESKHSFKFYNGVYFKAF